MLEELLFWRYFCPAPQGPLQWELWLSPPSPPLHRARQTHGSHSPLLLGKPAFILSSVSPSQQACFLFLLLPVLGEKGAENVSQEESSLEELQRSNLPAPLLPWSPMATGIKLVLLKAFSLWEGGLVSAALTERLSLPSPSPGMWEGDSTPPG